jgi:DNA uptake protein ComE-like DNA-binding protein
MHTQSTAKIFATFKRHTRIELIFFVFACFFSYYYENTGNNGPPLVEFSNEFHESSNNNSAFLVFQLDLNEADEAELTLLPRIGNTLADQIVEYRTNHNGFRSVDELLNIKGIGPKTLDRLRPYCREIQVGESTSD